MLDPDGPLGIHSYYPDDQVSGEAQRDVDVRDIRREAFYLSCGLFICNDTSSFEHSRARHVISSDKKERLGQLRTFVLNDFMQETLDYAAQEGVTCLHETMVPMCQFVRAVLNHSNLNLNIRDEAAPPSEHCCVINETSNRWDFQLGEAHACLECIAECLIKSVSAEEAMSSTISCVLVIELCGIACEAVAFNEHRPLPELIELVELVLSYLHAIYEALSKTSHSMDPLFAAGAMMPPIEKLNAYQFSPSGFRSIKMKQVAIPVVQAQRDSYGISLMRARTDLLTAIRRTVQQCKQSSDERLRSAVLAS
ncbi:hypothetical protein BBJ28_00000355 [Nothophytophthora sp. Chile5]|nr:hypothetical protein BBJ28_00000355 [Nothophytophthora sp. Chile5]